MAANVRRYFRIAELVWNGGFELSLFETCLLENTLADIADGWNNTQRNIGRLRASVATEVNYVL